MQWLKVTQNEAVFRGRDNYSLIDRVSKNFVGLALNFTPTWFQVFPGVDILAPVTWSQGLSGNAAVIFGGNEGGGNYSVGVAADVYQKYRFDLKYAGYYGNYSTDPTRLTPAGGVMGIANGVNAAMADRGWVSLTFKTTFYRRNQSCFAQSLMALAIASLTAGSAWAAVSADEAKQLGTTLTAVGAEKAGNKDGTIPEYTGGIKPPADFKAGSGVRTDPYASEKPRLVITGKDMAAQADKLTEGTKELLKRYPTMRVDVYPTHRTVALPQRVLDNTVKNATGAKSIEGGVATEMCWPDTRSRSRRPAAKRCGTTCCATTGWATTAQVRQLERRLGRRGRTGGYR